MDGVGEGLRLGAGVLVAVKVGVPKSGVMVKVGGRVSVAAGGVFVAGGVALKAGVLVGTFGTQSACPAWIRVEVPIQLADCSSATVVR
jgi:hypothetical protein